MATILCVDGDPATGVVLERHLAGMGHRPVLATGVEEALKLVSRTSVDLIIADCQLLDATGMNLLGLLQQAGHRIPVISMTGNGNIEDAVISIRSGAVAYLAKPIRPETLEFSVNQALELLRLRRENDNLRQEISRLKSRRELIGDSEPFRLVPEAIATVAPTRVTQPEAFKAHPELISSAPTSAGLPPATGVAAASAAPAAVPQSFSLEELEKVAIERALEATGGNRTRAAKLLGISERTLRYKLNAPRRTEKA